jgi:hypothetical protein
MIFAEHPNAWELELIHDNLNEARADEDEDEDEDESDTEDNVKRPGEGASVIRSSRAYQEFLGFLESGCAGSPLQGYPTVVVIVSTIPSSVCS